MDLIDNDEAFAPPEESTRWLACLERRFSRPLKRSLPFEF